MITMQAVVATVAPSEDLPDAWGNMAFAGFVVSSLVACTCLLYSMFSARQVAWFYPALFLAMLLGSAALAYFRFEYDIDYVAVGHDDTKASPPIWKALAIPSLPILTSLVAWSIYVWKADRRWRN